eukprot:m.197102 g.197102  ORF g.197102 m.197102 type:complete len:72 (-) comp17659_c0_seq3:2485-2700(-)
MGNCCSGQEAGPNESPEDRRRMQAEAAEKRRIAAETRGIKDPALAKRQAEQKKYLDSQPPMQDAPLKWTVK